MQAAFVYLDEAFGFPASVAKATDCDDVLEQMHQVLGRFGLTCLVVSELPLPAKPNDSAMMTRAVPWEWLSLYYARDFGKTDPVVRRLRHSVMPFEWHVDDAIVDDDAGSEVMERRRDFGILQGFCVPVPRRDRLAFVSTSGRSPEIDVRSRLVIHLVAIYGCDRLRELNAPPRSTRRLTDREREVLTWIALGKSAWEIGEILGIAKRTVDEHTQTAAHKLGARNRTQAVAVALHDRLITP